MLTSASARDRLAPKLPKLELEPITALDEALPAGLSVHEVPGCAFGELWLRLEGEATVTWFVCDMFMNIAAFPRNPLVALLMRLYGLRLGLSVSRSARRAIEDPGAYQAWLAERFGRGRHVLVPCHGEVEAGADLAERAKRLVDHTFGTSSAPRV